MRSQICQVHFKRFTERNFFVLSKIVREGEKLEFAKKNSNKISEFHQGG